MNDFPQIEELIPQRKPFLFVDKVLSFDGTTIQTEFVMHENLDFFKGHFPGNPIVPGVILQEALFQTGAAFMSLQNKEGGGLGVVTRVQNAKFKNMVRPNEKIEMQVELLEALGNASFMKGVTKVAGKTVLVIEFAVASI